VEIYYEFGGVETKIGDGSDTSFDVDGEHDEQSEEQKLQVFRVSHNEGARRLTAVV